MPTATIKLPPGLHPDTADLVTRFAEALAAKLRKAEKKYGYSDGWTEDDWQSDCAAKLLEHVEKGDPRDVAAYCAVPAAAPAAPPAKPTMICPRCKADRFKEPCPNRIDCPMVATALSAAAPAVPSDPKIEGMK